MKKKKFIDYRKYYCDNPAHHEDFCCIACFNHLKKPGEEGDYRLLYCDKIRESKEYYFILEAKKAGFTKKQAMFLHKF